MSAKLPRWLRRAETAPLFRAYHAEQITKLELQKRILVLMMQPPPGQ